MSLTSPVVVSLNARSLSSAVVMRGRSRIEHVERGRDLAQRLVDDVALGGERAGQPVQRVDRVDDVVALAIEGADEVVQAGQQIADLALVPGQCGAEVVDDVADLAQSAAVDDGRQRRQGLFGGREGR